MKSTTFSVRDVDREQEHDVTLETGQRRFWRSMGNRSLKVILDGLVVLVDRHGEPLEAKVAYISRGPGQE